MGSYHGAEVCDLVGLFILNEITPITGPLNIGLYRDDGLGVINQSSGSEKTKKRIIKAMSKIGFEITIDIGNTTSNFLDISLNLTLNTYWPFTKPNAKTTYINNGSNHPKIIRKNLPLMIENRLRKLSKCKESFDNVKGRYQNALKKSNFTHQLEYKEPNNSRTKRNRRRKCIYYNPPYCQSVQSKIGKLFLNLLDKHFKKQHEFYKIFNRNNVKISYCCAPNISTLISSHNRKISNENNEGNKTPCNCRNKTSCPVQNKCCQNNVIYQASITAANNTKKVYIGSTKRNFKTRFNEHKASFPKENKTRPKNNTQLANYLWSLKEKNIEYSIEWEILERVKNNKNHLKLCILCNLERLHIALADKRNILNKRNELITQCPHYLKDFL